MKNTPDQPWVRVEYEDRNPSIKGNAEGLKYLRDKIDEALESKHALMEDFDSDIDQIEVTDDYPEKGKGWVSRIFGWVGGIIVLLIFALGLIMLVGLVIFCIQIFMLQIH